MPRSSPAAPAIPDAELERGRYLVKVAGCNDCHTAGYAQAAGQVAEQEWLTGAAVGWSGPWGTSYPINLRLFVSTLSEAEWMSEARSAKAQPPMPWYVLRDMRDEDLRALYRYLRWLGPRGEPAPAGLAPRVAPTTPTMQLLPSGPSH